MANHILSADLAASVPAGSSGIGASSAAAQPQQRIPYPAKVSVAHGKLADLASEVHTPSTMPSTDPESLPTTPSDRPKPKKRGRKPKKRVTDPTLDEYEELDEDGLPKDPRRRRVLERNRIAATKCRLRKRDEASALANHEQSMEDQHRYLSSVSDSLATEILHLKNQLLQHTHCDCTLIQKYIAHQAKLSVDGMVDMSPAGFGRLTDSMSPGLVRSSTGSSSEGMMASPEADGMQASWPGLHPSVSVPLPVTVPVPVPVPPPVILESQKHLSALCTDDFEGMPMASEGPISMPATPATLMGDQFSACQSAVLGGPVVQQPPTGNLAWGPTWDCP